MLTVAIPTMDRWRNFLRDQLPVYLAHPKIACVVICDENGNDIADICEEGLDLNPKLRMYQNPRVLGVYGNKRQCLLKAPTEWVAVLDSDNRFHAEFFDAWSALDLKNTRTIYCGTSERLFLHDGSTEHKVDEFSNMTIRRETWNNVLQMRNSMHLLNDGNAIWPKEVVRHLPDLPEEQIVGTDSIFSLRQAIQAGYSLRVEPTLTYVHTVHEGSHWIQTEGVSSRLMAMRDWRV